MTDERRKYTYHVAFQWNNGVGSGFGWQSVICQHPISSARDVELVEKVIADREINGRVPESIVVLTWTELPGGSGDEPADVAASGVIA